MVLICLRRLSRFNNFWCLWHFSRVPRPSPVSLTSESRRRVKVNISQQYMFLDSSRKRYSWNLSRLTKMDKVSKIKTRVTTESPMDEVAKQRLKFRLFLFFFPFPPLEGVFFIRLPTAFPLTLHITYNPIFFLSRPTAKSVADFSPSFYFFFFFYFLFTLTLYVSRDISSKRLYANKQRVRNSPPVQSFRLAS